MIRPEGPPRPAPTVAEVAREASNRASWSLDDRYKHGKASRIWSEVAVETPSRAAICEILARQMAAYEAADAQAAKEFQALAASLSSGAGAGAGAGTGTGTGTGTP